MTLFQPGTSVWHRLPAGPKAAVLAVVVLAVSVLPAAGWWVAGAAAVAALACYGVPGIGVRTLARQAWAARWLLLVTATGQLVFQGPQHAVVNTARVTAVITVAALLALTTPVSDLLDALERGMSPLRRLGVDPARAALLMSITLTAIPALARTAATVREAQRARGCRASLRLFAVPFLVGALKHADELGDALAARGVR